MTTRACLFDLNPGQSALVKELHSDRTMRRRLMELGLTPGTKVTCLGRSPLGDPAAFYIRGTVIALRRADCRNILVEEDEEV